MSYIGKEPIVGNFQVCDAISVVNGQAAYTMQVSSTNVVPESANHMLVSLNGILQKPNSSFTVSGSTITFASNLATGDVIDFIMLLGNVLDIGTPSDSTVTDAKANFVSTSSGAGLQIKGDGTTDGTLQLNCSQNTHGVKIASPAHSAGQSYTLTLPATAPQANKALITDGSGNLSFADAGGITMAQQWRLTANFTGSQEPITSNLEIVDTYGYGTLGSNMTESSGIFTFPSTGYYLIITNHSINNTNFERVASMNTYTTTDGSNYNQSVQSCISVTPSGGVNTVQSASSTFIFDVTNTTTHKIQFQVNVVATSSTVTRGDTNMNETTFTFIRLGDT
jgi:deoxyribose-phosphate aldolase